MLPGSILQKLNDRVTSMEGGGGTLNLAVYYKNTLVALCHALEDALLEADYASLVITAFQRGQWYLQEADRYHDIAERSRHITIMAAPDSGFAEHPTSQLSNVSLVSLRANDPVGQEWHLIIVSPNYTAMVLCQELSDADYGPEGPPSHDLSRKFYGFWTFEPTLVQETARLAIAHIEDYDRELAVQLDQHFQDIVARSQAEDALCGVPTTDNLGKVVGQVVSYLQTSHQGLSGHADIGFEAYPLRLGKNLVSNELQAFLRMAQLIDQTDLSNPMAAAEVATLAESLGQLLDLPAWQLHRLRLAGLLHRIASLPSVTSTLQTTAVDAQSGESAPSCPLLPGTQILRKMNRMKAIATILTHQNEAWDGSGAPAALSGDAIPLESRILGLVSCFQERLAKRCSAALAATSGQQTGALQVAAPEDLATALAECQQEGSLRWDPKLLEAFSLLVAGLQQGLSLSVVLPRVSSGLWLLDSHSDEELINPQTASTSA
ncbi:MAG: DICT sensory domain-containing protein [Cyanobacteria bacterium J06638_20]